LLVWLIDAPAKTARSRDDKVSARLCDAAARGIGYGLGKRRAHGLRVPNEGAKLFERCAMNDVDAEQSCSEETEKAQQLEIPNAWLFIDGSGSPPGHSLLRNLILAGWNEDLPVPVGLHSRYEAGALHLLDESRRPVVADAKVALHQRYRRPARLENERYRLVVHRVRFAARAIDGQIVFAVAVRSTIENPIEILRTALRLQVLDDAVHFCVGHECTVHALRMPDSRRHIKHVALAEQRLGAHLIEDGTRVDLACDLKRDARWNVCLDEPGNHVDRWTLRREDQMDSRGTCLLRDAGDQLLDLLSGHHHEIGKLVDDDHDQRHFLDRFRRLGRQRERIGQRLARLFR